MDMRIFLSFEDYCKNDLNDPVGWITVAQADPARKPDSRYTFCAMTNLDAKNDLLKDYRWEIHPSSFGIPTFRFSNNKAIFDTGQKYNERQILIESFIIRREFHGLHDNTFDIIQNFILYHNLFFDHNQNAYFDVVKEEKVVEYVSPEHVRISENYLRDYLAARNMILIRYHDHRRHSAVKVLNVFGETRKEIDVLDHDRRYSIVIDQHSMNDNAFSRLLGKDLIYPYSEPKHHDYLIVSNKPQCYEKYAYKVGDDGSNIEKSCDQESAESKGSFLIPIFFNKDVLDRYHNRPRFYKVKDGVINCLDLWSIPFGENDEELVHVWLGDLGRIPYQEQIHWKAHNVVSGGKLNKNFVKQQLLGEFTAQDDPCARLLDLKVQVNETFEKKFNFKLFQDLSETQNYILYTFHTLTSDEEIAFNDQILTMAKLFVDTINNDGLKKNTNWKPSNSQENRSLYFLEHFLIENLNKHHETKKIVSAFRMIQSLRSTAGAHLSGFNYKMELQRYNLDKLTPKNRFVKILEEFYIKLELLNKILSF